MTPCFSPLCQEEGATIVTISHIRKLRLKISPPVTKGARMCWRQGLQSSYPGNTQMPEHKASPRKGDFRLASSFPSGLQHISPHRCPISSATLQRSTRFTEKRQKWRFPDWAGRGSRIRLPPHLRSAAPQCPESFCSPLMLLGNAAQDPVMDSS